MQRELSSGAYDTGASGTLLGKPVLVKIHADGVTGYGQIRSISPGHFIPDTVHSVFAAIAEVYGPRLIGTDVLDFEATLAMFDQALPGQHERARRHRPRAARRRGQGPRSCRPTSCWAACARTRIPLEWSISMAAPIPAKMIADAERAMKEFGIRVLCLKAGGKGGWQRDVKNFIAVRKAIGPERGDRHRSQRRLDGVGDDTRHARARAAIGSTTSSSR